MNQSNVDDSSLRSASSVLVADDDPDMRSMLSQVLLDAGYEVWEACDGAEVSCWVEWAKKHERVIPDAVVMDVRMPGRTGLELLSVMRRANWDVPVFIITGFGDASLHRAAEDLGAAAVLDKPFDVDELRGRITAVLMDRTRPVPRRTTWDDE